MVHRFYEVGDEDGEIVGAKVTVYYVRGVPFSTEERVSEVGVKMSDRYGVVRFNLHHGTWTKVKIEKAGYKTLYSEKIDPRYTRNIFKMDSVSWMEPVPEEDKDVIFVSEIEAALARRLE